MKNGSYINDLIGSESYIKVTISVSNIDSMTGEDISSPVTLIYLSRKKDLFMLINN